MNITVITVGKLKEQYLKQAVAEYTKRLSRYCKLNIIEVPDEKTLENLTETEMEMIKNREGENILKHIKEGTYVIALDLKGKMLSSEALANQMNNMALQGHSHVSFIIGGSLGLAKSVLQLANYRLCFSPMTFPHQLMRIILLEQVYRSFKIIKGEPYHK